MSETTLKAGLAMVEGKIDRTKYEMIKWMAGLTVAAVVAMISLMKVFQGKRGATPRATSTRPT